jgi:hypothetical protein
MNKGIHDCSFKFCSPVLRLLAALRLLVDSDSRPVPGAACRVGLAEVGRLERDSGSPGMSKLKLDLRQGAETRKVAMAKSPTYLCLSAILACSFVGLSDSFVRVPTHVATRIPIFKTETSCSIGFVSSCRFARAVETYQTPIIQKTSARTISMMSGRDEQLITKPRTSHCWYGIYFDIEAKDSAVEIKSIRSGSSR